MLEFLTKDKLEQIASASEGGHWDCTPLDHRWDYHQKAIDIIKALPINTPDQVLEIGTMGASLVAGSHTLDYAERWEFVGKRPNYLHDARKLPWPIKDKSYELFIALRVFQHLTPVQKECFLEAGRIAKRIIIVVPRHYKNMVLPGSKGITHDDFLTWNEHVQPTTCLQTQMGDLYFWDEDAIALKTGAESRSRRGAFPFLASNVSGTGNIVKKAIRKVLNAVGLELHRLPSKSAVTKPSIVPSLTDDGEDETRGTQLFPFIIEFIGPSGVGKTTLCKELLRTRGAGDRWRSASEALRYGGGERSEDDTVNKKYEQLLQLKLEQVCTMNSPYAIRFEVLSYFHRVVVQEKEFNRELAKADVVLDEGICHNFMEELLKLHELDPVSLAALIAKRIVINCVGNPSNVVARIRSREAQGRLMALHREKDNDELLAMIKLEMEQKKELVRVLREFHVPCLEVDVSKALHHNVREIRAFLHEHDRTLRYVNKGAGGEP